MPNIPVFCKGQDMLSANINRQATLLYHKLKNLNPDELNTAGISRDYFLQHHLGHRLIFSLQNSAHIIKGAIERCGKDPEQICFLDYGAGLGTLFLLAGMMGFKKNLYNDHLPDWHPTARALCTYLEIKVDDFIYGDIDEVMEYSVRNELKYDIIASRNVIEHLYEPADFYRIIRQRQPSCVVFSTTTANYHNPVMRWYHIYLHRKFEKVYYKNQRAKKIRELHPTLDEKEIVELIELTRGKAKGDFERTIQTYLRGEKISKDPTLRSNSCDCETGVWNEHLLTKAEYRQLIERAGYKFAYTAGYWDTHYNHIAMNILGSSMNFCISALGNRGVWLSPFVNIIAYP